MTMEEAARRVRLSIDQREWPRPCQITIEGPTTRPDGEEVLMVTTCTGLWGIRGDGSLLAAAREKMN